LLVPRVAPAFTLIPAESWFISAPLVGIEQSDTPGGYMRL
jgi:hypothetical protein